MIRTGAALPTVPWASEPPVPQVRLWLLSGFFTFASGFSSGGRVLSSPSSTLLFLEGSPGCGPEA